MVAVYLVCIIIIGIFILYAYVGYCNIKDFKNWDKTQAKVLCIRNRGLGSHAKRVLVEYEYNGVNYSNINLNAYGWGYLPGRFILIAVNPEDNSKITSKAAGADLVFGIIGAISVAVLLVLILFGIIG